MRTENNNTHTVNAAKININHKRTKVLNKKIVCYRKMGNFKELRWGLMIQKNFLKLLEGCSRLGKNKNNKNHAPYGTKNIY